MSPIAQICRVILACAMPLALLAACGAPNDQAPFDRDAQAHTGNWIVNHAPAGTDPSTCHECHGAELDGGIAKSSCYECHLGGPGSVHPLVWAAPTALNHSEHVVLLGSTGCSNLYCHGTDLLGGTTAPSCESCHLGGILAVHPASWDDSRKAHGTYVVANTADSCRNLYCHGPDLLGVPTVSPACNVCHAMPDKAKR